MLCTVSATQLKKITSGLEKMEKKAKKKAIANMVCLFHETDGADLDVGKKLGSYIQITEVPVEQLNNKFSKKIGFFYMACK